MDGAVDIDGSEEGSLDGFLIRRPREKIGSFTIRSKIAIRRENLVLCPSISVLTEIYHFIWRPIVSGNFLGCIIGIFDFFNFVVCIFLYG